MFSKLKSALGLFPLFFGIEARRSGSLAIFAAIRLASSFASSLAAERLAGLILINIRSSGSKKCALLLLQVAPDLPNSAKPIAIATEKVSSSDALLVPRLPSLSPRIVGSCRCVVQELRPLSGRLYRSASACRNSGTQDLQHL
jgi:hypothetical protein